MKIRIKTSDYSFTIDTKKVRLDEILICLDEQYPEKKESEENIKRFKW